MIHDSTEYPGNIRFVPKGTEAAVVLEPIYYTVSHDVLDVQSETRQCLFLSEIEQKKRLLDMVVYSAQNCMYFFIRFAGFEYYEIKNTLLIFRTDTKLQFLDKACNCVVSWMYPNSITHFLTNFKFPNSCLIFQQFHQTAMHPD
jgi:hypothetical protein